MAMWWVNLSVVALIGLIVWWFWLFKPREVAAQDVVVRVENGIYQPARIRLPAHRASALFFERIDPSPCAEVVLFPDLEVSQTLAVGHKTRIALPALEPGEYPYHCQMQMYRGVLVVE